MSVETFLDSNILIYQLDVRDARMNEAQVRTLEDAEAGRMHILVAGTRQRTHSSTSTRDRGRSTHKPKVRPQPEQ